MEAGYRPSPLLLGCLLALLWCPPNASSIILCDSDCSNNTELEICEPLPDSPGRNVSLPVMAFFPCNTDGFRARGLTVAAQMALRAVLRNTSILPGYRLELSFNNTMCSRLPAVRSFISQLRTPRYMIIGPGCSPGALPIAEISPFWNLTQVSYTATSITLSDKRRFPTFLRVIPSDAAASATVMNVVMNFRWKQVAIVTHINEVFSNLTTTMRANLTAQGVSVITERLFFRPFVDDTRGIVEQLNTSGARIVVLNMFENFAREVFCLAYNRGMHYPRYVFISHYWYTEYWWTFPILNGTDHTYTPENCTVRQITAAIFGSLAVDFFPVANGTGDEPTDVGTTPNQFWADFESNLTALNYLRSEGIRQAYFVYDAVWLAALSLHNASMELENGANGTTPGRRLSDFTYADSEINHMILRAAIGVNFRGVTGNVRINEFGDREPTRQVFQYRFTEVVDPENTTLPPPFATVDPNNGSLLYLPGESVDTVFPDGVPLAAVLVLIRPALFILFTTLSCLGILFAFGCLIFNLVFREKQLVKLSSPYLNVIITVGAMFFYVYVIIAGVDSNTASRCTEDILCQTRIWVATIGFTLFFGPILAKAFRVYYIFRNIKLKKKPIKDWVLYLVVAILVGVDVIVLSIITVWRLTLQSRLLQRPNGEIPQLFMECRSDGSQIWIPILIVYKGLFLLVGLFLAVQTYNVKIKELRDSKLIVASVFSITVISTAIGLVAFLVTNNPDVQYGVLGACILLLLTGILVLLFVTRMIELFSNPSGEIDLSSRPKPSESRINQTIENSEDKAKITELRKTVDSLKAEIQALKQKRKSGKDPLQTNHTDDTSTKQRLDLELNGTDLVTQNPDVKVDTDDTSTEQRLDLELNGTDLVTQNPDVRVDTDEDDHKL